MGAAPGSSSVIELLGSRVNRFGPKPSEDEAGRQQDIRDKLLTRLALPAFNAKTERDLEDWADVAARQVSRYHVCVTLFQEAWEAVSPPSVAAIIGKATQNTTHEELVDDVAVRLYPCSRYVEDVEEMLFHGKRQLSVLDAEHWVIANSARYLRLCRRRENDVSIANTRALTAATRSLPTVVEDEVLRLGGAPNVDKMFSLAYRVEEDIIRRHGSLPEPMGHVLPVEDAGATTGDTGHRRSGHRRPGKCPGCGNEGAHWYKFCPQRNARCFRCQELGHISNVCPNQAVKDNKGRVRSLVKTTPSSTQVIQKHDATQRDRMLTAESVLTMLRQVAEKRSEKAADRRKNRALKESPSRKRHIEHTAAVVEDPDYVSDDSEADSEDSTWSEVRKGLESLVCVQVAEDPREAVRVLVKINHQEYKVVADTGAAVSMCGVRDAEKMQLRITDEARQFRGLGRASARKARPVLAVFGTQAVPVTFFVVEQSDFPILIGVADLQLLNAIVDPVTKCLRSRDDSALIICPAEDVSPSSTDVVSGVQENKTDEELVHEAHAFIVKETSHLPDERAESIWAAFLQHQTCWLRPRSGQVKTLKASFEVKGPPIKAKIRPLAMPLRMELEKQVESMLQKGVIRSSTSPWGSVPVFVKKKAGEWRMCLDYRAINKRMKSDAYPLPLLWDNLRLAAHHQWYTCLDCTWGFWNIPLEEEAKEYTAFTTHKGMFEFEVLPFGIKNSPGIFQRAMDLIFGDLYGCGVLTYIDDIIIFTNGDDEHHKLLREVLRRCEDAGLFLRLSKSEIARPEVRLLGHRVSLDGIRPDEAKVTAIRQAVAPDSKETLRSFLGTIGYLRQYIPNFSQITAPLNDLLKKRVEFAWGPECDELFQHLKEELCDKVLLSAPRGDGPLVIVCDASNRGIGCALLQMQQGDPVLLEFGSKKLTVAEQKWDTREREAFAIKWSLERFFDFTRAFPVIVVTDHESLRWMQSSSSGKVQRWSLYMQQFDLHVVHLSGKMNVIADWLSRSIDADEEDEDQILMPSFPIAPADPPRPRVFAPFVPREQQFRDGYEGSNVNELQQTYIGVDGLRYGSRTNKLFVPPSLRENILYWFHASRYGGHCGINRTLRRVSLWVWWPGMAADVRKFVSQCLICIRQAPSKARTLRGLLEKPQPLQMISLDHVGPRTWFDRTVYYMVIIDHASRFMVAIEVADLTGKTTKDVLRQSWVSIFQAPEAVLTDRGPAFREAEFEEYVTQELCSYHVFTSAYYPQGNGINESSHRGLEASIAAAAGTLDVPFAEVLRDAVAVHNATPHSSLGDSPFFTMFGFDATLPGWQRYRPDRDEVCRNVSRREIRHRAMIRAQLLGERVKLEEKENIIVGDIVVYILSDYEKKQHRPPASTSEAYTPKWSLPSRVVEVNSRTVVCQPFGCPNQRRQVPRSQVKVLRGEVPQSLVRLNLTQIERLNPRYPRALIVGPMKVEAGQSWQALGGGEEPQRVKRTRPGEQYPEAVAVKERDVKNMEEEMTKGEETE